MIIDTRMVSQWKADNFHRDLKVAINELQKQNLIVEVQFQSVSMEYRELVEYSAIVIGRRK